MCRLLADAMVWNYVAKAGCLEGFLRSLETPAVILPRVAKQLEDAVEQWPELRSVLQAIDDGRIQCPELTNDEHMLQIDLLNQRPGLGDADCALLAVTIKRGWTLLTCDGRLKKIADRLGIQRVELSDVLDDGVHSNDLTDADRQWIIYYSQGGTQRRGT